MRVELRAEAREDLVDAAAFYEEQRAGLGDVFLEHVFANLATLETLAGIHEVVYGLYRKLVHRFPFAIYYLVDHNVVDVVAVLDCRREPEAIESRLGKSNR